MNRILPTRPPNAGTTDEDLRPEIAEGGHAVPRLESMPAVQAPARKSADPAAVARCLRMSAFAGATAIVVGVSVLVGWAFDVAVLKGIMPGLATMKPNTATCFILLGVALWLKRRRTDAAQAPSGAGNLWAGICAGLASMVGALTLVEYVLGIDLGVGALLFKEALLATGNAHPGRMAHGTASAMVLLGGSLLLLDAAWRGGRRAARSLALLGGLVGLIAVIGYMYGVQALYGFSIYSSIAVHTALLIALLGGGVLCARPDEGLMETVTSAHFGGWIVRRALPVILIAPLAAGWLRLKGEHAGWYETELGTALLMTATVILFAAFAWASARTLNRVDSARNAAAAESEATRRHLVAIVDSAGDAIIAKDLDGTIRTWNRAAERLLGYGPEEIIGQPVTRLIPVDRLDEEGRILERIRAGERVPDFETVRRRKDGSLLEVSVSVSPIYDQIGKVVGASKILRDISGRKRAEAALREGEERFRTMANSIPQLAWIARRDGYIFWYNERWYEYTGTTPEQMAGWGWQSVHDPEVLPKVLERWKASIDSGQPFEMEFPLRGADGRFRSFLTRVHPLKNAEGQVVQWIGTNTDVDELMRMERSLRATQARLNSTLAAGSIGTWTWDIVNDCLAADEFTARAFSIDTDAAAKGLPAAAYLRAVVEEDQPAVAEALARAIQSCGDYDIEYRVRQKDGELLWLQARGRVEGDAAGNAVSFHGAVMDITERKEAEAAIRESEERFRFLNDVTEATRMLADPAEIMAVMARMLGGHLRASRCAYADVERDGERFIILHDYTDGCASTVGKYQLSLFGPRAVCTLHRGETLIIRDVEAELLPGEGADMFHAIGIQAIITCPLVKDGVLRAMMAVHQTTPRDWQPGEIAIVQDVVERCWATIGRRTAEEELHELNATLEGRVAERTAQLEAANKELEAFSYSVSHDLRAPLRAVDGFSQAVLEDFGSQLPAEGRRYLQTIREGAQKMGMLIDDLLKFSRLSRAPLNKQTVNTGRMVRSVLDELQPQREGRPIDVRIGELPECSGDPALLKQVWINLLSNAFKYTQKRQDAVVEIGCEHSPEGDVFFVKDNGTGFDMRYAGKLFGVFQRLHRAEEYEGTGVGLALVQRVIHRHGGRVWADAALDRGATFFFTLDGRSKL